MLLQRVYYNTIICFIKGGLYSSTYIILHLNDDTLAYLPDKLNFSEVMFHTSISLTHYKAY